MKNFQCQDKETNKKYWISRSMAVSVIILAVEKKWFGLKKVYHILTERRGPGCPDFVGCYSVPCGYVDYDENLIGSAVREVYEELGLRLRSESLIPIGVNSSPIENRQNITFRFVAEVDYKSILLDIANGSINMNTKSRGGEDNEVNDIKLMTAKDLRNYKWAFGHNNVLKEVLENIKSIRKRKYFKVY